MQPAETTKPGAGMLREGYALSRPSGIASVDCEGVGCAILDDDR
jgi:hypothetical protein